MDSIFSFLQPEQPTPPEENAPGANAPEPAEAGAAASRLGLPAGSAPMAAVHAPIVSLNMTQVLQDMLAHLTVFLPGPINGIPNPAVLILSLNDAPVGLGNSIGSQGTGALGFTEVKGGRISAMIRFTLWGASPILVNDAMLLLQGNLLTARESLWDAGFLTFLAVPGGASTGSGFDPDLNAWNRGADYQILYEYQYEDEDAAQSLIARVPIHADQEVFNSLPRENTLVSDEMVRWDELSAPTLVLRGPITIRRLAALAFFATTQPTGSVTITRTYEGASVPVQDYPNLNDFLTALADTHTPPRHARVVFANLTDFLAQFTPTGSALRLGDWNQDTNLDEYQGQECALTPPIQFHESFDRLEVMYADGSVPFNQVAVLYLKLVNS